MNVCLSLASWPGPDHARVPGVLAAAHNESLFGTLSTAHVHLAPQTRGVLDDVRADALLAAFPDRRFNQNHTGADQSVMLAAAGGQLETNNYMPLIAVSLFKAVATLQHAILAFDEHCVQPMTANREASARNLLESTAIAPAPKAEIGFARAASLVGNAHASGRPLVEVIASGGVVHQEKVLDLLRQSSRHPDLHDD